MNQNQKRSKPPLAPTEYKWCLFCGEDTPTVIRKDGLRHCVFCSRIEFAECPPPAMTEEEWQLLLSEGEQNEFI